MTENRKIAVIAGAGPAGLTAAIYASRANLSVLIIEAGVNGGKLSKTYEIENYPGIKSISGLELANQLTEHGQQFGAKLIAGEVRSIEEGEILVGVPLTLLCSGDPGTIYIDGYSADANGTQTPFSYSADGNINQEIIFPSGAKTAVVNVHCHTACITLTLDIVGKYSTTGSV